MNFGLHLKKQFITLFLLFPTLILFGCASRYSPLPVETSAADRQSYLTSELDEIIDKNQSSKQPGVSIIVRKGGVEIYKHSKGLADINTGTAVSFNTAFEIASVSKPITAIAIMQLRERNLLSLSDSVLKWLPELSKAWMKITIHHLLSHQSGIPNFLENVPVSVFKTLDGLDNQKIIQHLIDDDTLLFEPGSNLRYSNSNYVLLAEIISRASGMSYSNYLSKNIFLPLGMVNTYISGDSPPAGTVIALDYGHDSKILGATLETVGPIGIHSSTSDLILLMDGLLSGELIKMESLRLMTIPKSKHFLDKENTDLYGYGWMVPKNESSVFAHLGDLHGFQAYIRINQLKDLYYCILGNNGEKTRKIINSIYWAVRNAYE